MQEQNAQQQLNQEQQVVQQQPQVPHKTKNLPNLGKHLLLDFVNIEKVDLNNYQQIHDVLAGALQACEINVITTSKKLFEPFGLTELFLLDHGHLTIHTWPEHKACAIDFYHPSSDQWHFVKNVEEHICDALGWSSCTSCLAIPRGKFSKIMTNDSSTKTEIYNQVSMVHREKSEHQDIRIYDTQNLGRILILDGYVQITEDIEDTYTIDMAKCVLQAEQEYEHILIIGGGDLLIANHIITKYPKVQKITLCEIDGRVIECVKEHFKFGETIKKAEDKINIVLQDGSSYIEQQVKIGTKYDCVIVDCSDTWDEDSLAYSLTTVEFYKNIKLILKNNGKYVQQLSDNAKVPGFKNKFNSAGLQNHEIYMCDTPAYGEDLPLAIITNKEEEEQQ